MDIVENIKAQHEIIGLKGRCLRMVDTKEWSAFTALLSDDFVLDLGQPGVLPFHGREQAVRRIQESVREATTVHHAHTPEFDFTVDDVAVTWAMHNRVVRGPGQPSFTLYSYHHDRWVKRDGRWQLSELRVTSHHLDIHAQQEP